jgi:ABC-2 type transport system permease protein
VFSTFSLFIACIVKTRERFMGVGQVLTMPLFFASNAIYPITIMPGWLKIVSHLNPLTYVVDALRTFMLAGSPSTIGLGTGYAVILLTTTILVFIGARLYPHLATQNLKMSIFDQASERYWTALEKTLKYKHRG